MSKSYSAGGVVINKKTGQVIVASQRGTSWSLPKGHLENDEDPLVTAKREIYEETGVTDLELVADLGCYERPRMSRHNNDDKSTIKNIHLYYFLTDQDELQPIDPHNPLAIWVPVEKVADYLTHPKDVEFFKSIISQLS